MRAGRTAASRACARVRGFLVEAGRRDLVIHAKDGFLGLSHAFEDALVLDAHLGVVFGLVGHGLAEDVVLARIGRYVSQDRQLVDVGIVFGIESFQFLVNGLVTCAGQACESLIDLDVGIADIASLWQAGALSTYSQCSYFGGLDSAKQQEYYLR